MRYFTLDEFDSPDLPGSGAQMQPEFLAKLDEARHIAGVPFRINSGVRSEAWNQRVNGSKGSSHLTGWAADISATTSNRRYLVLSALIRVGFRRIGIADTFIHVDMDPDKPQNVSWLY
jgi:zinc D-Ala-D-Ala carboxypeptidase